MPSNIHYNSLEIHFLHHYYIYLFGKGWREGEHTQAVLGLDPLPCGKGSLMVGLAEHNRWRHKSNPGSPACCTIALTILIQAFCKFFHWTLQILFYSLLVSSLTSLIINSFHRDLPEKQIWSCHPATQIFLLAPKAWNTELKLLFTAHNKVLYDIGLILLAAFPTTIKTIKCISLQVKCSLELCFLELGGITPISMFTFITMNQ